MELQSLSQLTEIKYKAEPKRMVIVAADDHHVMDAVKIGYQKKLIFPILIGNKERIQQIADEIDFNITAFQIIHETDVSRSSEIGVNLIKDNEASVLMKGMVPTATLLRSVVNKADGIASGRLLSHFSINYIPSYKKLLAISDVAMNINPTLEEKVEIIKNAVSVLYALDYKEPKVAIICPVETVNPKIESTVHAQILVNLYKENVIKNCIIEGPLALDNAISIESAQNKGIFGQVPGNADLLIVPNLDAGNILYKAINFLAGGVSASVIVGAKVPIVLTSRADSVESKMYSIALAAKL